VFNCAITHTIQTIQTCSPLLERRFNSAPLQLTICDANSTVTNNDNTVIQSVQRRAGRPGFDSRQFKIFLFSIASTPTLMPNQPHIQWVPWVISPGVKWQRREADHSPPSSAEVKKGGARHPLSHVFMAQCLLKHRANFTFLW
jgi:hypothetical protein